MTLKVIRKKLARKLLNIAHKVNGKESDFPKIQYVRVQSWFRDNRTKNLRVDGFELDENSIVFDVGGYKGEWAEDMFQRYKCKIFIFEPVSDFYSTIVKKFSGNSQITIFRFGLNDIDTEIEINRSEDASSVFNNEGDRTEKIQLKSIVNFISENNIDHVDLIKLNIEGGEYPIFDSLLKTRKIDIFNEILVQFHDFVNDAPLKMARIQSSLSENFDLIFQYHFVWERWKRK